MTLLSQILAPGCFGVEVKDVGQDIPLHPLEAVPVARAAPKRQRDFTLGRFCAHGALAQMGRDAETIPIGTSGAPVWPAGVVGSITHTQGYAAAFVGSRDRFCGIGLDAERIGGVTEALMARLFGAVEQDWLMALDGEKRAHALTVFFSAKEAFYKAIPAAGRLAFRDIGIEMRDGGFTARHQDWVAQGRLAVRGDLVVTAVIVPAP